MGPLCWEPGLGTRAATAAFPPQKVDIPARNQELELRVGLIRLIVNLI